MIIGNKLYFGYGDIAVGCDQIGARETFEVIRPSQDIGSVVDLNTERITEELQLDLSYLNKWSSFVKRLDQVKVGKIKEFEFDGLVFNFEANNKESLEVVLKYANRAVDLIVFAYAA